MATDRFGRPIKKKMIARKFSEGGTTKDYEAQADAAIKSRKDEDTRKFAGIAAPKPNSYADAVGDRIKGMLTLGATAKKMRAPLENMATLNPEDTPQRGQKKGGLVKSRGNGVAQRGKTKGRSR